MTTIDPVNQSLYFSAMSSAASEAAKEANKKEKANKKAGVFSTTLKKNEEIYDLISSGLPKELAGMSVDDAIVFLKDRVTIAGDELVESMTDNAFAKYKTAVGHLMKYVIKNSFVLEEHKRLKDRRTGREKAPLVQVQIIDEKLNEIASDILVNQADRLMLLKKVEEIQGLIIDLFAT